MEEWRNIIGYEGYYQVSNLGRVRSLDRDILKSNGVMQHRVGKLCNIREDGDGYLIVKLSINAKSRYHKVHRLVYEAFNGHLSDFAEVDHLDFNRKNNNLDNLRAVSHCDNVRHTYAAGRHVTQNRCMSGSDNPNFGNRTLSQKYSQDKNLAIEKQSRPGARNGRCRKIVLMSDSGEQLCFQYIRQCAGFLQTTVCREISIETIAINLSRAASGCGEYMGYRVQFG